MIPAGFLGTARRASVVALLLCCGRSWEASQPEVPSGADVRVSAVCDSTEIVQKFVQNFYLWYVPQATVQQTLPAYYRVLFGKMSYVTTELAAALRADSTARNDDKSARELLNFDPFLASQDPCDAYEAGEVRRVGSAFHVRVRPMCIVPSVQVDAPVVEVTVVSGELRIANVRYANSNLRQLLCVYAAGGGSDAALKMTCK